MLKNIVKKVVVVVSLKAQSGSQCVSERAAFVVMLQLFSGRYLPYIHSVDFAFCGATHFYYYSFTHQSRATYLDYSDNKPRYRPNPDLDLCSRTGLDRIGGQSSDSS